MDVPFILIAPELLVNPLHLVSSFVYSSLFPPSYYLYLSLIILLHGLPLYHHPLAPHNIILLHLVPFINIFRIVTYILLFHVLR